MYVFMNACMHACMHVEGVGGGERERKGERKI